MTSKRLKLTKLQMAVATLAMHGIFAEDVQSPKRELTKHDLSAMAKAQAKRDRKQNKLKTL